MKLNIYLVASLTLATGLMTSCSSSDDTGGTTNIDPVVKQIVGQAMEDATAEMQGTVYNALSPTATRAVGDGYQLSTFSIPEDMPQEPQIQGSEMPYDDELCKGNGGTYYIPAGKTFVSHASFNMSGKTLYVAGTLTLDSGWGAGTIYVLKGGTLNLVSDDAQLFHGTGTKVYNYGTLNKTHDMYVTQSEALYNCGNLNIGGKNFIVQGKFYTTGDLTGFDTYTFQNGAKVNILGNLDMTRQENVSVEGNIHVGGHVKAVNLTLAGGNKWYRPQDNGNFICDCGIIVSGQLKTNAQNDMYANYIKAGDLYQCSVAKIKVGNGGFIDIDGTYTIDNNGNDAGIVLTGGPGTHAVVKADKIIFNGSTRKDIYFLQTPRGGTIGVECGKYEYKGQGEVKFGDFDFQGSTVEIITDDNGNKEKYAITAEKGDCNPGYGPQPTPDPEPDPTPTPDKPHLEVISTQDTHHTHDISATCIQTDGTNVYLSFHKRGSGRSGCLERLTTTGDQTVLKQFVRDHDNSIDFNHLCLDKTGKRVYLVGNNKKGGFLGYMDLKDNGDFNCDMKKREDLAGVDSADFSKDQLYNPLHLVMLRQAEEANRSGKDDSKNGGDGNAVIVNDDVLEVASTYGFEFFNKNLQGLGTKKTAGKGKHIATTGNDIVASYFKEPVTGDTLQAIPLRIERYAAADKYMETPLSAFDANEVTPNNGKNTIAEYDGKIYSCQGSRGLYVYDANGTETGHYQLKTVTTAGKNLAVCANGVAVDNDYVYVAYGSRGLRVLRRSDLSEVDSYICGKSANYVALAGGYIYVAYGRSNIKVLKLVDGK